MHASMHAHRPMGSPTQHMLARMHAYTCMHTPAAIRRDVRMHACMHASPSMDACDASECTHRVDRYSYYVDYYSY
jgi:hypothetical protein